MAKTYQNLLTALKGLGICPGQTIYSGLTRNISHNHGVSKKGLVPVAHKIVSVEVIYDRTFKAVIKASSLKGDKLEVKLTKPSEVLTHSKQEVQKACDAVNKKSAEAKPASKPAAKKPAKKAPAKKAAPKAKPCKCCKPCKKAVAKKPAKKSSK